MHLSFSTWEASLWFASLSPVFTCNKNKIGVIFNNRTDQQQRTSTPGIYGNHIDGLSVPFG
jgi:hypothetical protein